MLAKIREFVKEREQDLFLAALVFLVALLSFGAGFLTARYQGREEIRIENPSPPP